jgi:hypothetical protein
MSRKVKPFHLSILNQLRAAEEKLSKNKNIGLFVSRFVVEIRTITTTICNTSVPIEHLPGLISGLEFFYQEFEANYPRNEDACGGKYERNSIEEDFKRVITALQERLPVPVEIEAVEIATEEIAVVA